MKVERLLHAFSMIGEDPARIQQLRQVAVALAVAGKLDSSNATLSPRDMMQAVEEVKADLVRRRAIPKPKKLQPVDQVELPEGFPDASRFAPLGGVARVEKGLTGIKQAQPGPFPLVVTGAERASCDHFDFEGAAAIIPLVSSTGHGHASLNRLHYQDGKFALGTILAAVFPYDPKLVSARFIFEYLSAFKEELLVTRMTGTANVTLSIGRISEVPVPLVDPTIQAQVDELMALLDRLEAARAAREATRDRLTAASLARLTVSDTGPDADPADFPANARFALATLPALTTRPDQIKPLRQTILNLAVRGKLVEQDPTDEPASILLDRAKNAKKLLREQRRIGRSEDPEYSDSPGEADAPRHWAWGYLADFALVLGGKRMPAGASFAKEPTQHIYIRVTDMKGGTISDDGLKFISAEVQKKIAKYTIDKEDIFITIAGTIGEVGIVPAKFDGQNLTENAAKIVFREIDRDFLVLALRSDDVQHQFTEKTKQMAQPKLALKRILGARVPLPPLAEQHRIVAKVDALMALCDRLEAALTTTDTTRARLLEALLHEALDPAAEAVTEAAE